MNCKFGSLLNLNTRNKQLVEKTRLFILNLINIFFIFNIIVRYNDVRLSISTSFFEVAQNFNLHMNPKLKLKKTNWENCKLCNYSVRNTLEDSTNDDVIIASAIGATENVVLFMRTLRTTGCKAKCVLLMDEKAILSLTKSTVECVNECGGQIINCGKIKFSDLRDCQTLVYLLCYEFIYYNIHRIRRVIIVDLFDTVFQGDPFNSQVGGRYLNILDEGSDFTTYSGYINEQWMRKFNYDLPDRFAEQKYLCTGYIGGDVDVIFKFLRLFYQYMSLGKGKTDQGEVNYLYFSGILEKNGIHIVPERMTELVRHTAYVRLQKYEMMGEVRTIKDKNTYASIIHHYYCNPNFILSLYYSCPRGKYDKNNYFSHCDTDCYNKMEFSINHPFDVFPKKANISHKHKSTNNSGNQKKV